MVYAVDGLPVYCTMHARRIPARVYLCVCMYTCAEHEAMPCRGTVARRDPYRYMSLLA